MPDNTIDNLTGHIEQEVIGAPIFSATSTDEVEAQIMQNRETVRESLARNMLYIFASVCLGMVAVFALFIVLIAFSPITESQYDAIERLMTLMASSLLPAVVGIFGSVIGFYFGSQSNLSK